MLVRMQTKCMGSAVCACFALLPVQSALHGVLPTGQEFMIFLP
jgi:hypothetical protein